VAIGSCVNIRIFTDIPDCICIDKLSVRESCHGK
jgi:hypothetical protein